MITLVNGKYVLFSHAGKKLGTYKTMAAARKREKQVNYFKNKKK